MDAPDADDLPDTAPDGSGSRDDTGQESVGEDDPAAERPGPTPQSAALRRQQLYVGYAGALVAGGALGVGTFQQATDSPALAMLVALAGTGLVLWLVRKSIFPGGSGTE